MIMGVNFRA